MNSGSVSSCGFRVLRRDQTDHVRAIMAGGSVGPIAIDTRAADLVATQNSKLETQDRSRVWAYGVRKTTS